MNLAYHFCDATLRDGTPIPEDGVWEVYDGQVVMCESGLHASRDPFDALNYAPGATLRLVEVDEIVEEKGDKLVCRRRRTVKKIDATDLLRLFARQCARDVIHLWNAPQVVVEYLNTGDETLRGAAAGAAALDAAWDAAMAAAGAAARAAAGAAARAAAGAAARAAAWDAGDAARAAAGAAARAAAWADAWADAWAAQRKRFNEMIEEAFK